MTPAMIDGTRISRAIFVNDISPSFTPFLGGLLADRYFGYRRSIIMGGIMMGIGYLLMGVHNITVLYIAMTLVIFGNGFFKPNISTLLGNVYTTPQHIQQKDEGYNIFYMGINIGAFICNFFWRCIIYRLRMGLCICCRGCRYVHWCHRFPGRDKTLCRL